MQPILLLMQHSPHWSPHHICRSSILRCFISSVPTGPSDPATQWMKNTRTYKYIFLLNCPAAATNMKAKAAKEATAKEKAMRAKPIAATQQENMQKTQKTQKRHRRYTTAVQGAHAIHSLQCNQNWMTCRFMNQKCY